MLHITTWHWGTKYGPEYLERLRSGLSQHCAEPYRLIVASPQSGDEALVKIPGCFARLRMFDPNWQQAHGIKPNERVVCIDLDVIVTGPLAPLFARTEPFMILRGANAANPCPYNGSLWMLRAGYRPDVWTDFSLAAAAKTPYYEFPDDQGWFWHKLPKESGWLVGPRSGIYAFKKPAWPKGDALPEDARLVCFPGWRDPGAFTHLEWVRRHWLGEV